jgi:homogentisate 1,2-dioxygenase
MPTQLDNPREYQDIFHWAETQKDGSIPSFGNRKNDPYDVSLHSSISGHSLTTSPQYQPGFGNSFESEAVPGEKAPKSVASETHLTQRCGITGTIPKGQNSPRSVRFGLYAEQMTGTAFVAPRHLNKKASVEDPEQGS